MLITSSPKNKLLLGDKNKSLNKRVLSTVNLDNSVLVVDLSYYSSLVNNKLKFSSSFREKWPQVLSKKREITALQAIDMIFEPILKLKRLVIIQSVILLCESPDTLKGLEKEIFNLFTSIITSYIVCNKSDMVSSLYSLAVDEKEKYIILSDNLDFWAICSTKSKIVFCVITKNNNVKLYIDKFGLEYLSAIIGTNKLVNKLRLSKLKYVNLQYLFVLLLYTKFKHTKANETFDLSDNTFLGSKGKALEILSTSHREISYYFLTKSDLVEIFLTSSATHFVLNLTRLLKTIPSDMNYMSGFSNYYANTAVKHIPIVKLPIITPVYKLMKRSKLYCFHGLPRAINTNKKELLKPVESSDIQSVETSTLVNSILRGLSW